MLSYRTPIGLRLGGGATMHLGNALETSGSVLNSRVEFENKPGFLFQAEYMVVPSLSLDLRYTVMTYTAVGDASATVEANSLGAGMSIHFGR